MRILLNAVCYLAISAISLGDSLPKGISVHHLNNGLEVILMENTALPMVGVNVVVKTGSAYETFATSGISHMLEHLLFNGTTTRTQKELYDDTDRIGGYNNANTGEYYTNYMMVTPAEKIRTGMEIQADMLFHSTLPEEKFQKEKGIVLEEIAQNLADPETQIERDVQSILFHGHSLSLPTLGTYSTIESLPLASVRDFYTGNYVPNNMILSAIGNFDSAEMLEWIKDIYGKPGPGTIERPTDPELMTGTDAPEFPSGGVFHRTQDDSTTLIHLAYPLPLHPVPGFFDMMDKILNLEVDKLRLSAQKTFPGMLSSISTEIRRSPVRNYLILKATAANEDHLNEMIKFLEGAVKKIRFSMKKEALIDFASSEKTAFFKSLEKPHMFGIYNAHVFAREGIDGFLAFFEPDRYTKAAAALKRYKIKGQPIIILHHPLERKNKETGQTSSAELFAYEGTGTTLIAKQNSASPLVAVHALFKHKARLEREFGKDASRVLHECFGQRMKSPEVRKQIAPFGLSFTVNDNPYIPMD
ncbi:MAG: M16 family metallopeptidase, partial [Fidelibacterota bacterium]